MVRTKLLLFVVLLLGVVASRAADMSDRVVVGELMLAPGGEQAYFTVSLEGSEVCYTAYDIKLTLPAGMELIYKDGAPYVLMAKGSESIYPSVMETDPIEGTTITTYSHSLQSAMIKDNVLRVLCYSATNESLTATSGALFHVFVKASPYAKPGVMPITVADATLVIADGSKYVAEDHVSEAVQASTTSTLTLEVSAMSQYATCVLPFDYALPTDSSLVAYACEQHTDDALLLIPVERLQAYTPYILYSELGFSAQLTGEVDAAAYPADGMARDGLLVGVLTDTPLGEGCYVMQDQGEGVRFYYVDDIPYMLTAGKCYVEMPEGVSALSFYIGETTAVQPPQVQDEPIIYNILGQRVQQMIPGRIYIVNDRKVIAE